MEIAPYLSFKGQCEAAFSFYEKCLGGEMGPLFRYGGSPLADQVPPEWRDKIMHGSLRIGEQVLMGADPPPDRYEEPRGFTLSLQIRSEAAAERVFQELATGGKILMPLEKTFWAALFGEVVDQYGIAWQINCEGTNPLPEG